VTVPAGSIALDLGHGAFAGLASLVSPESLAAVFISHLHPDHFVDLVPLRHWLRYHLATPGRVRVDAPADLAARLDGLHAEPGFTAAALDVVPLEPGPRAVGPFVLEVARVRHTTDSFAVRVTAGHDRPGLVYSGDVGAAEDLAVLIQPGDVLLVEASFGAGPVPPSAAHLDGPMVGHLAAATRPRRVLLTHLLPDQDEDATVDSVREWFDGPVELVAPGTIVDC
jgi:ribonuclease BN (tRNA processing enzyme)